MTDYDFSYPGIEYEEAIIWVASLLCDAIVPLFAHFSVLLHAFLGIVRIKYMFRQLAIIIGCLAVGEFVVWLTGVSVPSSIIGMLFLTTMLKTKVVRLEWVETTSSFLVKNMGFFFVPPGVALMLYFDVIRAELMPIVVATVVSTMLVLVTTGWVHALACKGMAYFKGRFFRSAEESKEE